MAKIALFMLCDTVENNQSKDNTITHLVSPQAVLRPLYIPSSFSFGLSVGVRGLDLSSPITLRFIVCDPDGNIVQDSGENTISIGAHDNILPMEHQGFVANIDVRNFNVPKEGVYKFTLFVNGEELEAQDIPIYRGM